MIAARNERQNPSSERSKQESPPRSPRASRKQPASASCTSTHAVLPIKRSSPVQSLTRNDPVHFEMLPSPPRKRGSSGLLRGKLRPLDSRFRGNDGTKPMAFQV